MSSTSSLRTSIHRTLLLAVGLCIIGASVVIARGAQVSAQALNVEISPVKANLTLDPGTTSVQTIRVRNGTDRQQTFFFNTEDFTIGDSEGNVAFYENDNRDRTFSLEEWITFDGESITIPPQDEAQFDVFIEVPRDAEPGGHYAAVFVQTAPPNAENDESSSISTIGRIGSLLLVDVPGDVERGLELVDFMSTESQITQLDQEITLHTTLRNTGNVHVEPEGTITVSGFGVRNEPITFNEGVSSILPGTPDRVFENTLKLEKSGIIPPIGRVTAELNILYGDGQVITAQTSFLVVPYMFIAVVLGVVIVLSFIIWRVALSFRTNKKVTL